MSDRNCGNCKFYEPLKGEPPAGYCEFVEPPGALCDAVIEPVTRRTVPEASGLSWSGHNVTGDAASIAAVQSALHAQAADPALRQRIADLSARPAPLGEDMLPLCKRLLAEEFTKKLAEDCDDDEQDGIDREARLYRAALAAMTELARRMNGGGE